MYSSHTLLSQEVSDLNLLVVILNVGIDREVGIDQAHLVCKAICDSLEQILQQQDKKVRGCQRV